MQLHNIVGLGVRTVSLPLKLSKEWDPPQYLKVANELDQETHENPGQAQHQAITKIFAINSMIVIE